MRPASRATWATVALGVALMLVSALAIGPHAVADAEGQAAGGPTTILECEPLSDEHAAHPTSDGNPSAGPETADQASDERTVNALWCVSGISGDHAPEPVPSDDCGGGTTGDVTIDSSTRGFDWVC